MIAIIAVLLALLLPAVQQAREAANRAECANHLKQIGLAFCAHEVQLGYYPSGGWGANLVGEPDRGNGKPQPGGWCYQILDYIDQGNLRRLGAGLPRDQQMQANAVQAGTGVALFYCPSRGVGRTHPNIENEQYGNTSGKMERLAVTDYATCAGSDGADEPLWSPGSLASGDSPEWWLAHPPRAWKGIVFQRSQVRVRDVTAGTSNVYLAGEKYAMSAVYYQGSDEGGDESCFIGMDNNNSRCTYYPPKRDAKPYDGLAFGSAHAGGCAMVYCDGHVAVVTYTVSPAVHRIAGSRFGQ